MLGLVKEVTAVAQQLTVGPVKSLKHIIRRSTSKTLLTKVGQTLCWRRFPKWYMVRFVGVMGRLRTGGKRQL